MKKKLYIETLGCSKNWVESEYLIGNIKNISITNDPQEAEFIVINTCSFLQASRQESIDTILELSEYKKTGACKKLIVSGCLTESNGDDLLNELQEVDIFCKSNSVHQHINTMTHQNDLLIPINQELSSINRINIGSPGSNYLKISEGCNHKCSFCTIPQFKGRLKSRSIEDLVRETKHLVSQGITEINLVGQDLSDYGSDLKNESLVTLLRSLIKIKGVRWLRLLYLYPTMISDELIKLVKNEENIAKYFDIPLQHLDNKILKLMNRSGSIKEYEDTIHKIRSEIDESSIRTTLIVGFPGETDDIFQSMLERVKNIKFNNLGAFQYSPEESTKSFQLENHVSSTIKKSRYKELLKVQSKISEKLLKGRIGKTYDILIEEQIPSGEEDLIYYLGRSQFEAPDVDGNIIITSYNPLPIGTYAPVKITHSKVYDLNGVVVNHNVHEPSINQTLSGMT